MKAQFLIVCLLLAGLLAGCQGIAFSPEAAVQQQIFRIPMQDFHMDPATYQVLQTVELDEIRFVFVSLEGTHLDSERATCQFVYEAFKHFGGWSVGGGGGGCSNDQPDPDTRPVSIGVNTSGGRGQNDPGHTTISGMIFRDDIRSLRVAWSDGVEQEASISNQSFIAVRAGNFNYSKLEAFDSQGKSVFLDESNPPATGKQ